MYFKPYSNGDLIVNNRLTSLDLLRLLAALFVVFIHGHPFTVQTDEFSTFIEFTNLLKLFGTSLIICAVPEFVLLSGYFKLGKGGTKKILKDIVHLLRMFFVWSVIYLAYNIIFNGYPTDLGIIIIRLFMAEYHMWFIPMICGVYLLIPILDEICQNRKVTIYFLLLSIVFSVIIPTIQVYLEIAHLKIANYINIGASDFLKKMAPTLTNGFVFYFVAGDFIRRNSIYMCAGRGVKRKCLSVILLLSGMTTTCVDTIARSLLKNEVSLSYDGLSPGVVLTSLGLFLLSTGVNVQVPERLKNIITYLSDCTLVSYCIHVIVLDRLNSILDVQRIWICLMTFTISMTIAGVIRSIPLLRKILA